MSKEKYVLKARILLHQNYSDGYYTGQSYIYQNSRYAVVDRDISKAKIYTSKTKAERASEMSFENYTLEVEKFKEIE